MNETTCALLAVVCVLALLLCVAVYALREFVALFHRHSSRLMMPPLTLTLPLPLTRTRTRTLNLTLTLPC